MSHLTKYTNNIDFEQIMKCNINRKSFLEILCIALQKIEFTCLTAIQDYIERILPTEEYNNIETFVKDYRTVLKELGIKNESTELANNMPISIQVQLMEMKIFENIEHQLMDAEQYYIPIRGCDCRIFNNKFKMSSTKLNAKVELYTSKEKKWTVTFAKMVFRNIDVNSNCDIFLIPFGNRLKNNANKYMASDSKA
ncbi:hypothetical protein RhiirC2_794949 [Rhizophagus irregularis]|uniref:Uncharacterized protein n=1 Tax=Rhizophagus irregularis TaxID=588596 RepID=A0A2N1MCI5_9GLOM|nr:hypothetical protein RhiirC2_794949 [Rhizophagus irregularis]